MGLGGKGEGGVPEGVGFGAVEDDAAEFVEFEVPVGVEGAVGGGAVGGDGFEGFEAFFGEADGGEAFFAGLAARGWLYSPNRADSTKA